VADDLDAGANIENVDEESASRDKQPDNRERRTLGTLALLVVAAIIVLLILTQCTARVPNIVGLDRNAAQARLKHSGLKLGDVSEVLTGTQREGLVAEQIPESGVMLRTGGTVDITLTRSTHLTAVPDVMNISSANAAVTLQQAGFAPDPESEYSDTVPIDEPIRQSPVAGTLAAAGSAVTVYYSLGPQGSSETSLAPATTGGGSAGAPGSSGAGSVDTPIFSTARAYPGAVAWSSGGDIYVRLTPGGATRRVTSGSPWDTNPVISPSHRYLVFMRAPSSGARPTVIGATTFTGFVTHMLTTPMIDVAHYANRWVGPPIFAPSAHSTTPDSDWIVYPHYFIEWGKSDDLHEPRLLASAQLLICKVPFDTTWISWNNQFRPARTLKLSASTHVGCVRVRQTYKGRTAYDRNLYLPTGIYIR
jgi:hypothetical protein